MSKSRSKERRRSREKRSRSRESAGRSASRKRVRRSRSRDYARSNGSRERRDRSRDRGERMSIFLAEEIPQTVTIQQLSTVCPGRDTKTCDDRTETGQYQVLRGVGHLCL